MLDHDWKPIMCYVVGAKVKQMTSPEKNKSTVHQNWEYDPFFGIDFAILKGYAHIIQICIKFKTYITGNPAIWCGAMLIL